MATVNGRATELRTEIRETRQRLNALERELARVEGRDRTSPATSPPWQDRPGPKEPKPEQQA